MNENEIAQVIVQRALDLHKEVLTYLKLSNLKLGLLINFGGEILKGNIERLANNLEESNP